MDEPEEYVGTATYSPEDNKLRLYAFARLSKETYARVKSAGFKWAPKQELFVAPMWTPDREDLLLELCGEIDDEDYSPEERAADRAERFGDYRDKRRDEAGDKADRFDAGPSAFGHQNRQRAERKARRHDRLRTGAVSQWSKAEYWQMRTEGVISHALYKSSAPVRRSRILTLEADLRKLVASYTPADDPPHVITQQVFSYSKGEYLYDGKAVPHVWVGPKGRGGRWAEVASLERIKAGSERWRAHYELRLTYERAMLNAEGGSAAEVEMEVGGWIGKHQIHGINKSPATGRVVSVKLMAEEPWYRGEPVLRANGTYGAPLCLQSFNIERLGQDAYRPPTDEEREAFVAKKKSDKKPPVSLINPTDEDAARLQLLWVGLRKKGEEPREFLRMTQSQFSNWSGDNVGTIALDEDGQRCQYSKKPAACKVRVKYSIYGGQFAIILTDKPQKPIPLDWEKCFDAVNVPAEAH